MSFKIGDYVWFKRVTKERLGVPDYECFDMEDEDEEGIIHGQTLVGDKYFKKGALIVNKYRGMYLVRYYDSRDNAVQLLFYKDDLVLTNVDNWKQRIGQIDAPSSVTE